MIYLNFNCKIIDTIKYTLQHYIHAPFSTFVKNSELYSLMLVVNIESVDSICRDSVNTQCKITQPKRCNKM